MRSNQHGSLLCSLLAVVAACTTDGLDPMAPGYGQTSAPDDRVASVNSTFNLEVILRGAGFGLVEFRQSKGEGSIIELDTWVRGLASNTNYQLQRAVDPVVDDQCTSAGWLTLGAGPVPRSIVTDADGTGRAELFRDVSAFPVGAEFDIHFRVVEESTQAPVLTSECYQFYIRG